MTTIYLGFGSNLGDRAQNIVLARERLRELGVDLIEYSALYESEPFYFFNEDKNQPWFLNQVARAATELKPLALLQLTQQIEKEVGRTSKSSAPDGPEGDGRIHYAPRVLDIDILLYDDLILKTEALEIPHPRFHARRYDLKPLAEIAPRTIHPIFKKSIAELLAECKDKSDVQPFTDRKQFEI